MAEYTPAQRYEFIRDCIVAMGYLPREVQAVQNDPRATNREFDGAVTTAMERHGIRPYGVDASRGGEQHQEGRGE